MFITNTLRKTTYFIAVILIMGVTGCSSMPTTNSGVLSKNIPSINNQTKKIDVIWHLSEQNVLTNEEKQSLSNTLASALEKELKTNKVNIDSSSIHIRAAITRIETVSPTLNILSTLLVFAPLDRGGIAIEFDATDINNKPITQLNFAQWTPMSEFSARFNRFAPAELAITAAANAFVTKLVKAKLID